MHQPLNPRLSKYGYGWIIHPESGGEVSLNHCGSNVRNLVCWRLYPGHDRLTLAYTQGATKADQKMVHKALDAMTRAPEVRGSCAMGGVDKAFVVGASCAFFGALVATLRR